MIVRAAPPPLPSPKSPISAENAAKVGKTKEFPLPAYKVALGPQPGELTVLDHLASLRVVDDADFKTVRTVVKDGKPTDFAFGPGGKLWAWCESNESTYTVENTTTGQRFTIDVGGSAGNATFSPDGKRIAIGKTVWNQNAGGGPSSEVMIYDAVGKLIHTLEKSGAGAITPLFSPDGKYLAIGNRNHETRIFEADTGKLLHTFPKRMTQGIAYRPDGKRLAVGYVDGTVGVLDVETGKVRHVVETGCKEVYSIDWSKKGDVLATSGLDGKAVLWDAERMTKLKELDADYWVGQVKFSADGSRLFTASAADNSATTDRKIVVWAVTDGR